MTKSDKLKAVIYCRTASSSQGSNNNAISNQELVSREFASREGYEIEKVFHDEAISGNAIARPGFDELLDFLRARKNKYLVIIYNKYCFARDMKVYSQLLNAIAESGGKLESLPFNGDEVRKAAPFAQNNFVPR